MEYEKMSKAAQIISRNVLTPIIYMLEHEDWVEFVCFCDGKITIQELYNTEQELKELLEKDAEVIDIREFSEFERLDIINQYELIHTSDPIIEKIFTASMMTDYQNLVDEKRNLLNRRQMCGSYLIQ
jgi:hypothetical protein